jgi:NAD(P)-dependent dehydrogenase (short-subunit alcohol dehydrogenase family)
MGYIEQLFGLSGRVAVITGGEGILGSTLAKAFVQAGVKVAILGINEKTAVELVEELNAMGGEAIACIANVLVEEQLAAARDLVLGKWGKIDILINAAGGNMPGATISPDQTIFDLKVEDFKKVSELNLTGTVLPSMVFGKVMTGQGKGSIVNFSSMAATRVITRVVGYSASKAGIDNFTRWMACEMAFKFGEGIRVNAIAPGFLVTNQNRRLLTNEDGSLTARGKDVIDQTPFKRFGEPDELVGTILYLCSDAAKFVTGTVIPVDGGFSIFSGV